IDFKTIRENDSSMKKGNNKTVQDGENGIKEKEIEITYEDGEKVSRETLDEEVTKKAVDRIIKVGTKVEQAKTTQTASRGSVSRSSAPKSNDNGSYRTMQVAATAYSPDDAGVGNRTST